MEEKVKEDKNNFLTKWWFWGIVIIIVVGIVCCISMKKEKVTTSNKNNENVVASENIVEEDNIETEEKVEKHIFLAGTNIDQFIGELVSATDITDIGEFQEDELIFYEASNDNYFIRVGANKNSKEIEYVNIAAEDVDKANKTFTILNNVNYKTENEAEFTSWLKENIGKEASIKIGDALFNLGLNENDKPEIAMEAVDNN